MWNGVYCKRVSEKPPEISYSLRCHEKIKYFHSIDYCGLN